MPYPNEHAARVRNPGDFQPDSFRRKTITSGISLILGRLKGETTMTAQSYRFDAKKFTAEQARKWLADHKISPASFEAATGEKAGGLLKDGLPASSYLVVEDPEKVTTWHLPVKDASGKPDHNLMGGAWAALTKPGGHRGNRYEGPGKQEAIAKLRKMYEAEGRQPPASKSFKVFKQADGSYRWVLFSSSAFRDKDGEIITARALEEDVDRCDAAKEYGPLRWWHLGGAEAPDGEDKWETYRAGKGVDIGACDFNMLYDRMLIESGTFKSAEVGEAFGAVQDDLEASIAFSHPLGEPGEKKQYDNIHRFERSLLPEGMASNLLTKFSVLKEDKSMKVQEKLNALIAILKGKPEVAKAILDDAVAIQKAAEEAGLEFKEVEEMVPAPVVETEPVETVEVPANTADLDFIGDMTHQELATFVTDLINQGIDRSSQEVAAKQASTAQAISDALVAAKALAERFDLAEAAIKEIQQSLLDLTDARPAGVKQLQSLRPTESETNIVATSPAGPHMDEAFVQFMTGGKKK